MPLEHQPVVDAKIEKIERRGVYFVLIAEQFKKSAINLLNEQK